MAMLIVYSQLYSTYRKGDLLSYLFATTQRTMNTTYYFICHGFVHQQERLLIYLEVIFELGFQTHCLQNCLGCLASFLVNCKRMAIISIGLDLGHFEHFGSPITIPCFGILMSLPTFVSLRSLSNNLFMMVCSSPKSLYDYLEFLGVPSLQIYVGVYLILRRYC